MMRHRAVLALGKSVRALTRLRGGSGSALPGLVVERVDPQFLSRVLRRLPLGVVVISGSNGKTTTTKMVTRLLESQGLRVFTNPSGSNFTRGVVASVLTNVNAQGWLDADIAVLELDEAHATYFVRRVAPRYCLLLNVLRDQLDRFAEIDHTAQLLGRIASATTQTVVLNRDDARVAALAAQVHPEVGVHWFGVSPSLAGHLPSDDQLYASPEQAHPVSDTVPPADVLVHDHHESSVIFRCQQGETARDLPPLHLQVEGLYNAQNAAGALSVVREIVGEQHLNEPALLHALEQVQPAFGRGEVITVNGVDVHVVLVKNPSGFRCALQTGQTDQGLTMIAVNDQYADGRDMSWLWDVDFTPLVAGGVQVVSGTRAFDMALRLLYDDIAVAYCEADIAQALQQLLAQAHHGQSVRIFCTYTAMLAIRAHLSAMNHHDHREEMHA